jgi:hypothetical protein
MRGDLSGTPEEAPPLHELRQAASVGGLFVLDAGPKTRALLGKVLVPRAVRNLVLGL